MSVVGFDGACIHCFFLFRYSIGLVKNENAHYIRFLFSIFAIRKINLCYRYLCFCSDAAKQNPICHRHNFFLTSIRKTRIILFVIVFGFSYSKYKTK